MFFARMSNHEVQEPQSTDDGLGFKSKTYGEPFTAPLYIVRTSNESYTANDYSLSIGQWSGYCVNPLKKGALIDSLYRVEDCFPAHSGYCCYLSSIGDAYE